MKKDNNNNLLAAIVLSVGILVGFQYFYVKPQQEQYRQYQVTQAEKKVQALKTPEAEVDSKPRHRDLVIKDNPRVSIMTEELQGSINIKGAKIDDLSFVKYHETIDPTSPKIILLSPSGSAAPHAPYYTEFNWLAENSDVPVPTSTSEWKTDSKSLTEKRPVKFTWDNGRGLVFERTIAIDDQFMFTLTDRVINKSSEAVTLYPFGLITRQGDPSSDHVLSTILYEGPLGAINGTMEEYSYEKLREKGKITGETQGGWLGITDKYWLVAMLPPQEEKFTTSFAFHPAADQNPHKGHYQNDFRGSPITIESGKDAQHVTHLFAGAKRLRLIDHYGSSYNIPHFDRAIDFGWFYFLTKPFLYFLDFLGTWFGSFGLAILIFTVLLKIVTLPLSAKSYHSMSKMKLLAPEMKRIQERFADDKLRQSQEMMELYKREKVNPMSGCMPTLIQIPIFFALYKVLYVSLEMRHAPFYGWIKDLSAPDPTSVLNLFGLIPWELPTALHIGVWPVLMGISMYLQQKLSPQPPDKTQARIFMFMPILFTYMLAQMPSGLVIYWTWSNLLSIAQQWWIMRKDLKAKKFNARHSND